nr:MAG TPA: hypothetical protein [Caudoviricetes sp.]
MAFSRFSLVMVGLLHQFVVSNNQAVIIVSEFQNSSPEIFILTLQLPIGELAFTFFHFSSSSNFLGFAPIRSNASCAGVRTGERVFQASLDSLGSNSSYPTPQEMQKTQLSFSSASPPQNGHESFIVHQKPTSTISLFGLSKGIYAGPSRTSGSHTHHITSMVGAPPRSPKQKSGLHVRGKTKEGVYSLNSFNLLFACQYCDLSNNANGLLSSPHRRINCSDRENGGFVIIQVKYLGGSSFKKSVPVLMSVPNTSYPIFLIWFTMCPSPQAGSQITVLQCESFKKSRSANVTSGGVG